MKFSILVFCSAIIISPYIMAEPLDLNTAWQRILESSPALKAAETEVCVVDAEKRQVGKLPNPALSCVYDNIGGKSRDCESDEICLGISQLIELGGKRSARVRVASSLQSAAYWEQEDVKLALFNALQHAFIDVATAQEQLVLAEEQCKVSDEFLKCVLNKRDQGKASLIEEKKAQIALQTCQLYVARKQTQFMMAQKKLASLWGSCAPDFDTVDFPLFALTSIPCLEDLQESLDCNPALRKADYEINRACEVIQLRKANSIPDIVVSAGIAHQPKCHERTFSVGFDIPIPIFNQYCDDITRAEFEHLQAQYRREELEQKIQAELASLFGNLQAAHCEVTQLKGNILSAAEESLQISKESYNQGKYEYLELLDAQKTLFDIKLQYLDAAAQFQHIKADLEKLTAHHYN